MSTKYNRRIALLLLVALALFLTGCFDLMLETTTAEELTTDQLASIGDGTLTPVCVCDCGEGEKQVIEPCPPGALELPDAPPFEDPDGDGGPGDPDGDADGDGTKNSEDPDNTGSNTPEGGVKVSEDSSGEEPGGALAGGGSTGTGSGGFI